MSAFSCVVIANMFLIPPVQEPHNPWKEKVSATVAEAERAGTVAALAEGLETAWRADDWQAGLRLSALALEKQPDESRLRGAIVRALWRGGRLEDAERLAEKIALDARDDRAALVALSTIHLARGEFERAAELATRLEKLRPATAADLYYVVTDRLVQKRFDGFPKLLRKARQLTDPANGYPEIYGEEHLAGLAKFFESVGTERLNQIAAFGSAPMPLISLINLPGCSVMINGQGPYRMILDTGGSIALSLDEQVAEEIGLKSVAKAAIRGVSGKDESGQALVDELRIGPIVCRRVMTRIFGLREQIMGAADGIVGTGIFAEGRLTLDFEHAELRIAPSSAEEGIGSGVDIRIVGDAKLLAAVTLQGEPAVALLDSGANAVAYSPSRLAHLFPDEPRQSLPAGAMGVGGGDGPTGSWGKGVDLVFVGRSYPNYSGLGLDVLDTMLSPILGVQIDALVGMPVFRDMKSWTVDFPRCRMWVDWLDEP
jgi:tetratricopeptide (TPR) repeat protein